MPVHFSGRDHHIQFSQTLAEMDRLSFETDLKMAEIRRETDERIVAERKAKEDAEAAWKAEVLTLLRAIEAKIR